MRGNYPEPILPWLAGHEGGFVDHPADPGGATDRGVTQATYDAFRRARGLPMLSVRHMTDAEHAEIYRTRYWDVVRGDDLPSGVDYCVFDAGVNSGPSQAAKWLQRAIGVEADGYIGPVTLAAALQADPLNTIERICDQRLGFMRRLRHWPTFGKGWARRVGEVEDRSRALAASAALPPPWRVGGKGGVPLPKPSLWAWLFRL